MLQIKHLFAKTFLQIKHLFGTDFTILSAPLSVRDIAGVEVIIRVKLGVIPQNR